MYALTLFLVIRNDSPFWVMHKALADGCASMMHKGMWFKYMVTCDSSL